MMTHRAFLLALGLFTAFFCSSTLAGHIDLFETAHSVETTVGAPPAQGVGSIANPTATALGIERDLFVNKVAGADDERLRARVNPLGENKLRIDSDAEVKGSIFLTWDGVDGDPNPFTGVDYDGLGGIDLTDGYDGFDLIVSFSDIGGPVKLSIFDSSDNSAASFATATFNVPAGIPSDTPTPIHVGFADFTGTTSALTDAGAILMEVMDESAGWDLNITSLVRTVPEPASLALLSILPVLGLLSRKRAR